MQRADVGKMFCKDRRLNLTSRINYGPDMIDVFFNGAIDYRTNGRGEHKGPSLSEHGNIRTLSLYIHVQIIRIMYTQSTNVSRYRDSEKYSRRTVNTLSVWC